MKNIIDLSDFGGMDAEVASGLNISEFEVTRIDADIIRLDSKVTDASFFKYYIPGRLPVGARVTVICETRQVSGDRVQLRIDSFTDDDYTAGIGGGTTINGTASDEFVEVRATLLVKPSERYVRVGVGFHDSRIGTADIRSLRVEVDGADLVTIKPQHLVPANMSRVWSVEELNKEWGESLGAGSIVRTATEITITGDGTTNALVYGATTSNSTRNPLALYDVDTSKGAVVSLKGVRTSGLPAVLCDYLDAGGITIRTLRGYFLGNDDEWQDFFFPPLSGAKFARFSIGFFNGVTDGVFELKGVRIQQFGAISQWGGLSCQPIVAHLVKQAGSWVVDNDSVGDGSNRFSYAGITSVLQTASNIGFTFAPNSIRGIRPIVIAQMDAAAGGQGTYYLACTNLGNNGGIIVVKDRATDANVDPSTMPDGHRIQMIGFGIR